MSTAVACRRSLVLGQSPDLYVLWYVNQTIVATSNWFRYRDGGHLADFYVTLYTLVLIKHGEILILLLLYRHGESTWNKENLFTGWYA